MAGFLKESGQSYLGYAQSLSILCCIFIVVSVLPSAYAGTLFAWHPIFMSIGYLIFMCEGIMIAYRVRDLDGNSRVGLLIKHFWTQVASVVCVSLGFAAIYVNKSMHGKSHFTSLHGKLGLVTYFFSLAAVGLGVFSFKKTGFIESLPSTLHPFVKWIHRLVRCLRHYIFVCTFSLSLCRFEIRAGWDKHMVCSACDNRGCATEQSCVNRDFGQAVPSSNCGFRILSSSCTVRSGCSIEQILCWLAKING